MTDLTVNDDIFTSSTPGELGRGLAGNDQITASQGGNTLRGGDGNAKRLEGSCNDIIYGGNGFDDINGGLGADILTGGGAADFFTYDSIKDSGLTKATRDEIMDFTDGQDLINLFSIDAIAATVLDEDFSATLLLGNGAFTQAGQLRIYQTATGWMIEGEVTGDGKADFSIAVRDLDHSTVWQGKDFFL